LTADEAAWIDGYHARVHETIAPLVDVTTRAWLLASTGPLPRAG
jgi:Xaa-Pro aminopeptidase